jgi:hypothetical protein
VDQRRRGGQVGRLGRLAGALAAVALAASCKDAGPRDVTLREGQELTLASGDRLRFERVVSDSRCPRGVTCIWAGEAKASLNVRTDSGNAPVALEIGGNRVAADTLTSGMQGFRPVTIGRYQLTLLQLDPYPMPGKDPLAPTSTALIRVEY